MSDTPHHKSAAEGLRKTLNRHGHGFQYRILRDAHGVQHNYAGFVGGWEIAADEVPVHLRGKDFHIDGIAELAVAGRSRTRIFAVIECKRADPARARWCFVNASSVRNLAIVDSFTRPAPSEDRQRLKGAALRDHRDKIFHLGFDQRVHGETGDGDGKGKGLDDAVDQVLRGAGGLTRWLFSWIEPQWRAIVVPVIITSAELFTSDVDLTTADLRRGEVDTVSLTPAKMVLYNHNVTMSLMPENVDRVLEDSGSRTIEQHLAHSSTRTIVIANGEALKDALAAAGSLALSAQPFI